MATTTTTGTSGPSIEDPAAAPSDPTTPPPPGSAAGGPDPARPSRRRGGFGRFGSIQSKLLAMLLATSIVSTAVVGFFGYRSGTTALTDQTYSRLRDVGDARLKALATMIDSSKQAVILDSQGVAKDASPRFNAAYAALSDATLTPAKRAALTAYYRDTFAPRLQENVGGTIDYEAFVPSSPARSYLQANYTVNSGDFDKSIAVDDAGDGSDWSAVNAAYNPFFRDAVSALDLDDALMIDAEGNIVYTAYKGSELGSNIKRGEFRGGGLEKIFDQALKSNSLDYVAVADFEEYNPSYGKPTMFIASPIGTAQKLTGVLVYEISGDAVNTVLTGSPNPGEFVGLGQTGESYVVGSDGLLRSDSRLLFTDPEDFRRRAIAAANRTEVVDRIIRTKTDALLLQDNSEPTALARRGESGTVQATGYLGQDALITYAPAKIEGLDWSIITKIGSDEALAPVDQFARNLLLATAGVILLICALSVLLARVFTGPLNRLLRGVREVAGGKLGTQVDTRSRDEFGDLAVAFNDMSTSLLTKQSLLEAQQAENDRMLSSMMPESVAKRYRGGETSIAAEHHDVSVVYATVEGFDGFAAHLPAADAVELLNTLSRSFEDAARKVGVEKVRSVGTGYIASSGAVVQRVDHARRVVDFALEFAAALDRFNSQHSARLTMRAGIDTGDVQSGLIGRQDVVYNLWGSAVDLAFRVRTSARGAGIYITGDVRERLGNAYAYEEAGTVEENGRETVVWRLSRQEA